MCESDQARIRPRPVAAEAAPTIFNLFRALKICANGLMPDRRFDIDKFRAADVVRFKAASMSLIRLAIPLFLVVVLAFMSAYTVETGNVVIERAKGIAEANRIINSSLTAAYLQHEINTALMRFADNEGSVVVLPANMQGFDLILDGSQLRRTSD